MFKHLLSFLILIPSVLVGMNNQKNNSNSIGEDLNQVINKLINDKLVLSSMLKEAHANNKELINQSNWLAYQMNLLNNENNWLNNENIMLSKVNSQIIQENISLRSQLTGNNENNESGNDISEENEEKNKKSESLWKIYTKEDFEENNSSLFE